MSAIPIHPPFQVLREADGSTIRFLPGTELTGGIVEILARRVPHLIAAGHAFVTLDLGPVAALDSAALGKLLALHRVLRGVGGQLTLANLNPDLRRVLRLTRLDTVLTVRAGPTPV